LSAVTTAFAAGEPSYSKVRAITRVATPDNEDALVEMARAGTASHLERIVRAYRDALGHDEVGTANRAHDGRFVHWHHDDEGAFDLRGRLPAEDGALVVKALELAIGGCGRVFRGRLIHRPRHHQRRLTSHRGSRRQG
jgi:hypothetical protein